MRGTGVAKTAAIARIAKSHSFFDVPRYGPSIVHSDKNIARIIRGHGFSPTVAGGASPLFRRSGLRNEGGDFTVLHAANSHAPFEARILRHVGFGIGHIENVVLVDEKAAWATELFPFREEHTIRVKYLDTIIGSVSDKYTARRIDRQRMVDPELAWAGAPPAPRRNELAATGELDDPSIGVAAMPVTNDDVAINGNRDVRWRVEHVGPVTCDTSSAERQQYLALRTELDDLMALAIAANIVSRPHIALAIDIEAMGVVEEALANAQYKISRGIESVDRIKRRVDTVSCPTSLENPDAFAVGTDIDSRHLSHLAAIGHLQPIRVETVWVGGAIRVGRRLREQLSFRPGDRSRDDPKQQRDCTCAQHGYLPAVAAIFAAQYKPLRWQPVDIMDRFIRRCIQYSRVLRPGASANKPAPREDQ